MSFPYTHAEKTVKKYTVQQAVDAAKLILQDKHHVQKVCMNPVKNRTMDEKISLEELNNIQDSLVFESLHYA